MSKPFLVIQLRPEDEVADNELDAIRRYGELQPDEVSRLRAEVSGIPDLDLGQFSGIIVGGSPFDVGKDNADKSPIQRRIESDFNTLFDQVLLQDFPFLGCCSGNGLLGNYLGASISTRYGEPVGGVDLTLTPAGRDDPLLKDMPSIFRVMLGHKEACDETPAGSVLLASSDTCPVQMFRVHHNVYATQFHPEADAEGFCLRINSYRNHGYFPPETADALIAAVSAEETPHAQQILRNFVSRYRV